MGQSRMKKLIKSLQKKNHGFTMIELVVTLTILAVIAAFTVPSLLGFVQDASAKDCRARIEDIKRRYLDEAVRMGVETPRTYRNFNLVDIAVADVGGTYSDGLPITPLTGKDKEVKSLLKSQIYSGICPKGGQYYIMLEDAGMWVACTYPGHTDEQADRPTIGLNVLNNTAKDEKSKTHSYLSGTSGSLNSTDSSGTAADAVQEINALFADIGLDADKIGSWKIEKLPDGGAETGYNLYWSQEKINGMADGSQIAVTKYNTESKKYYTGTATVKTQDGVKVIDVEGVDWSEV